MVRAERLDTAGARAKVGNYGFYTLAKVVNTRLVRTGVDLSPLEATGIGGEFGHHSRPE
jgi:hypothetical protein